LQLDQIEGQRMTKNEAHAAGRDRRGFLLNAGSLTLASLIGWPRPGHAEPPPETTRIRLVQNQAICLAPQYLSEELLRLEGFTQIEYPWQTKDDRNPSDVVDAGRADITMDGATALVPMLDAGRPLVILAGVHGGCYQLHGNERVRAIRDLKGKKVAIGSFGSAEHTYVASMLAYVGVDPRNGIDWVETHSFDGTMQLFIDRQVDAFLGFPPQPQHLRAKKLGHVIVNTAQDRPWSQHFCCMIVGHRDFVNKHPVATKRVMRAILKAADICAREPERVADYIVKKGHEPNYDVALEVVKEVSYNAWRSFDAANTLRFHALRLHEVGMIKSEPNKLIAQGTDWRFLNELKRELKA
jgi:NitT/TauT family transport system substrate-binding protein